MPLATRSRSPGKRPGVWSRIVLVAPTWRGPLPTMMGRHAPLQRRVEAVIRAPAIGPALYNLNVSAPMVGAMYRRHVYADASRVTPAFVAAKSALARRRGGRFGSAAFVTGALDVVRDRDAFLALASPPAAPILVLYGDATPPRSLAEMTALAALPGVASQLRARRVAGAVRGVAGGRRRRGLAVPAGWLNRV